MSAACVWEGEGVGDGSGASQDWDKLDEVPFGTPINPSRSVRGGGIT